MPLSSGTRLGPYEVLAPLGAGGMGEVYRARDTRLNREVALKVLPPLFAGDPDRLRRFQREAEMASALNHAHIVTVHDVGEFEGRQYLVTEYVAGGTLRDWVKAEQRGWREIVDLLAGVADGLAAAHEANILHRDIKPANILVSKNGNAKLADFGLAKLVERVAPLAEDAPTATAHTTRPGMILGTVAYMSPEQASGQTVDVRSDIFSFGVVLYESLSGRRPFAGGSELEELKAIVHGTAPPLPDAVPAALRMCIEKALEKDPADRYQSMREMAIDLRRLARHSGEAVLAARPSARRFPRVWAVLAPVLLIAGFLAWRYMFTPEAEPLRAVPLTTLRGVQRHPTLSPDGNYVAFAWSGPKQDNPDIWVQQIGAGAPLRLTTDPANDSDPAWSPDGRWIAFLRSKPEPGRSELWLLPPLGGPGRNLAEIRVSGMEVIPPHLTWCPDSKCLIATDSPGQGQPDGLLVISLETGAKTPLTHPKHPALGDTNPAISADGNWLVFVRKLNLFAGQVYLLPLGAGMTAAAEPRRLTPAVLDAIHPAWVPGGKEILFSAKRSLWRLAISGEKQPSRLPFIGEDGIMPVVSQGAAGRGRLVYVRSAFDVNIWRIDTSAAGVPATSPPLVAVSSTRSDGMPSLSPDGRRVAFWSDRSGEDDIWVSDIDGSNAVKLTSMQASATGYPHWSPDGQFITYHSSPEGKGDVYLVPAAGGKARNVTNHPPKEAFPSFSGDGQWIYLTSSRTGEDRVWKIRPSGTDAAQLTDKPGYMPQESADRAYFYYVDAVFTPGALWRQPIAGGDAVKLFDGVILGNYVPLEKGVYYIDRPSGEKGIHYFDYPLGETRLQYFDFATRRSTTIARNLGNVDTPLTATRDGRTILFSRSDSSVDDLMLVENFR